MAAWVRNTPKTFEETVLEEQQQQSNNQSDIDNDLQDNNSLNVIEAGQILDAEEETEGRSCPPTHAPVG